MSLPWNELRIDAPKSVGVVTYPPGATFGPRTGIDYEFVWIIAGDAEYRFGDVTSAAPAGSIVLCRPGTDYFRWDPDQRTRHAYFHFNIHGLPKSWPRQEQWPLVRVLPEGDVVRPLFRHVLTWHRRGDELLQQITAAQILAAFVTGEVATREVTQDRLPDAVEMALHYLYETLDDEPSRPIGLDDLADAAAVTPEHLCRLFKSATGLSPAETVRLARLDRAAVLLARSNYAIGQIAELCGFASQFHFSRRFKEAFGVSPRDLRKQLAQGMTPPLPKLIRRFS
jgi:AraC family transcriptional regulator